MKEPAPEKPNDGSPSKGRACDAPVDTESHCHASAEEQRPEEHPSAGGDLVGHALSSSGKTTAASNWMESHPVAPSGTTSVLTEVWV